MFYGGKRVSSIPEPEMRLAEMWAKAIMDVRDLTAEQGAIQKALPSTYFADRELPFRVERIVEDWRRLIMVNKQLQEEHDAWQDERDNLRQALELARPQHKVVEEDCWYSCPLSDECCNDEEPHACNCGADDVNAQIDAALGIEQVEGGSNE